MKTNGHQSALEPVIEKVAASAHKAVDRAERAAGRAAGRAQRAVGPTADLVSQSCDYVSANPLKSVGIAAVAGFLLSRIFF